MASTTPYPPSRTHTSTPLPPSAALSNLSAYLSASETTPWLHPDARLASDEIRYSTTGGPTGGIVLHNLRRIQQGLAGEVLAADPDDLFALPVGDDAKLDEGIQGRRKGGLKRKVVEEQEGEWQDLQQYQLQQEELIGEVGERGAEDGEVMDVDGEGEGEGDGVNAGERGLSKRDKEARKDEKKKRRKAERREKEESKTKG